MGVLPAYTLSARQKGEGLPNHLYSPEVLGAQSLQWEWSGRHQGCKYKLPAGTSFACHCCPLQSRGNNPEGSTGFGWCDTWWEKAGHCSRKSKELRDYVFFIFYINIETLSSHFYCKPLVLVYLFCHQRKMLPASALTLLSHQLSCANHILDSASALLLSIKTQEGRHIWGLSSMFQFFLMSRARKISTSHQQPCKMKSKGECFCARNRCCRIHLERRDLFRSRNNSHVICLMQIKHLALYVILPYLHQSFPWALSTPENLPKFFRLRVKFPARSTNPCSTLLKRIWMLKWYDCYILQLGINWL